MNPGRITLRSKRLAAGILTAACLVATGWWIAGGSDGFQQRTVGDLLTSSQDLHPIEATSALCKDPACVEGWRTDHGDFLRFGTEGEADRWATILGDEGRRWRNIVLDMRGKSLTFEQQRLVIDTLFSAHDWS